MPHMVKPTCLVDKRRERRSREYGALAGRDRLMIIAADINPMMSCALNLWRAAACLRPALLFTMPILRLPGQKRSHLLVVPWKGNPVGLETIFGSGFITSQLNKIINWGRKNSFFPLPFVTACCGMEFMATWGSHYDVARFGAELPRFSPRQSDLLMVVGTINHKIAPVLKRVYDQMCEPKWVIAFGACASSGGFYRNYATVQGIDRIIPVDVYIAGCPPRPEAVLEGLMLLQKKVEGEDVLNRGAPIMVNGQPYSEAHLVHIEPPVDRRADHVVASHEGPGVHPWQGFEETGRR